MKKQISTILLLTLGLTAPLVQAAPPASKNKGLKGVDTIAELVRHKLDGNPKVQDLGSGDLSQIVNLAAGIIDSAGFDKKDLNRELSEEEVDTLVADLSPGLGIDPNQVSETLEALQSDDDPKLTPEAEKVFDQAA